MTRGEANKTKSDWETRASRNDNFNRISQKIYSYNQDINLIEIMDQFACLPHTRKAFQRPNICSNPICAQTQETNFIRNTN